MKRDMKDKQVGHAMRIVVSDSAAAPSQAHSLTLQPTYS